MRSPFERWTPHLRRYRQRLPIAVGVGLIVGVGMAAFALVLDQPPLVLGLIAGIGSFFMVLYHG